MTEEKEVVMKEVVMKEAVKIVHPAIREFSNEDNFIATTGFKRGAMNRYEVLWPVPKTDKECQERYGKDLAFFIRQGVKETSHAPDYKSMLVSDEYSEAGHKACQKLADEYKPGNRATGTSAQNKLDAIAGKKAQASASSLGFASIEEALAFAAEAKAKANRKKK